MEFHNRIQNQCSVFQRHSNVLLLSRKHGLLIMSHIVFNVTKCFISNEPITIYSTFRIARHKISMLVLFFSRTLLILGLQTSSTCATTHFGLSTSTLHNSFWALLFIFTAFANSKVWCKWACAIIILADRQTVITVRRPTVNL